MQYSLGQIKVSDAIHEALREQGVAGRIDQAVRKLMPDQASRGGERTNHTA